MNSIRVFFILVTLLFLTMTHLSANASNFKVIVGIDEDYPPYEFVNEKGEADGLLVELTKAISEVMGFEVEFRMGDWQDMVNEMKAGRIDILQGVSWSEERAEKFSFTPASTMINHAIFARKGTHAVRSLEELSGKEVIVHEGGIMQGYLLNMDKPPILTLVGTPDDTLRLLASGQHDYAVVALLPGMYIIKKHRLDNLIPVAKSVAVFKFGYASLKDNQEIISRFSEGLAILKHTGEFEKINSRWLGVIDSGAISWPTLLRYMMFTSFVMFIVLSSIILWSYSLKRKVASKTASLSQALDELQANQLQLMQADKMAALGVLVSGVAHEINNPNGLILLNTPIVQRAFFDIAHILDDYYEKNGDFLVGGIRYSRMKSEIPEILEDIHGSALRIKRIVNDLKDFARRDDTGTKEVVELNECLRTAIRLIEPEIKKSTDNFSVIFTPYPANVFGNSQRIEQVIVNMLLNACQALITREQKISAVVSSENGQLILEIEDGGKGISKDDMSHIAEPFFTTKRDSGGTGLGVAVSDSIMKEHNGSISFVSEQGKGTKVILCFQEYSEV
jgi:polar amino acid transport system substrate-binding protein